MRQYVLAGSEVSLPANCRFMRPAYTAFAPIGKKFYH